MLGLVVASGCSGSESRDVSPRAQEGRLSAAPSPKVDAGGLPAGVHRLPAPPGPRPILYVPRSVRASAPAPFVLALPGAGNDVPKLIDALRPYAEDSGAIVLGVGYRSGGWDILHGGFGRDVAVIDDAMRATFRRFPIDPGRVGVAGYSDGASYALSLGLTNGELFTDIVAFSPGFLAPAQERGSPRVHITHGTEDPVLPIEATSRRIVPRLRDDGYRVIYREFAGGHKIPHPLLGEVLGWMGGG